MMFNRRVFVAGTAVAAAAVVVAPSIVLAKAEKPVAYLEDSFITGVYRFLVTPGADWSLALEDLNADYSLYPPVMKTEADVEAYSKLLHFDHRFMTEDVDRSKYVESPAFSFSLDHDKLLPVRFEIVSNVTRFSYMAITLRHPLLDTAKTPYGVRMYTRAMLPGYYI